MQMARLPGRDTKQDWRRGRSPLRLLSTSITNISPPDLYDTMKIGMGDRTQPLQVVITTAGINFGLLMLDRPDLANKVDITAMIILFRDDDGYTAFGHYHLARLLPVAAVARRLDCSVSHVTR